jgi:hypothetical protein
MRRSIYIGLTAILVFAVSAPAWSADYEVHPYTPAEYSPTRLAEKRAALDALREKWTNKKFSDEAFTQMALRQSAQDQSEVIGHFLFCFPKSCIFE